MKKTLTLGVIVLSTLFTSCSSNNAPQANFQIVPLPQQVTALGQGYFMLNEKTEIVYTDSVLKREAEFLSDYIDQKTDFELDVTGKSVSSNAIILSLGLDNVNPEAYKLVVSKDNITITGSSAAGVFYGVQSLRKSLPVVEETDVAIPTTEIIDYPRFAYRGTHLDVSRHFVTVDSVKRFIDMLALHNINRFHWHLTDDQGWRLEIKALPELTTVGSKRSGTMKNGQSDNVPYGGYYTQEEARDIVRYAADRHVTIVPEIDLPGHMQAALTAYPELGCTGGPYEVWTTWGVSDNVLCAGNDSTMKFIEKVFTEVIDIFPSEYIHVGGDECPKTQWAKCPKCQDKIKSLGIKGDKAHSAEMRLQSYVISYAENFLNSKGRQIIGWDEILEGGLAPNATVMSWRGTQGGIEAAKQKHDAIMTPTDYLYFDYYQTKDTENEPQAIGGYVPIEKVYSFEPVSSELTAEEAKYIIGVQANIWTEYMPNYAQMEYMSLPRMAALSEVQWSAAEQKNYDSFLKRLWSVVDIYEQEGYNYAKHIFNVNTRFMPNFKENVVEVVFNTIDDSPVYYTLDGSQPTAQSSLYSDTLKITENCTVTAIAVRSTGASVPFVEQVVFNKATSRPVSMLQPINKQYEFEGASVLVDGLKGSPRNNYRTGRWIGFYQNDMEAVIDLGSIQQVSKVDVSTYVHTGDWVFDARSMAVSVSEDGVNYQEVASENYPAMEKSSKNGVYNHELSFAPVNAKYVKVKMSPERSLPEWHGGKGAEGFLFVDEISIN